MAQFQQLKFTEHLLYDLFISYIILYRLPYLILIMTALEVVSTIIICIF